MSFKREGMNQQSCLMSNEIYLIDMRRQQANIEQDLMQDFHTHFMFWYALLNIKHKLTGFTIRQRFRYFTTRVDL